MADNETKPKRKRSWPNVYSREHRSGQGGCIVDLGLINGNREPHSFETREEADTFGAAAPARKRPEAAFPIAIRVPPDYE